MKKGSSILRRFIIGVLLIGGGFAGLKFSGIFEGVDYSNQPTLSQMKEQFSEDIQIIESSTPEFSKDAHLLLSTNFLALARAEGSAGKKSLQMIYPKSELKHSSYFLRNGVGSAKISMDGQSHQSLVYTFTKQSTNYWIFFKNNQAR